MITKAEYVSEQYGCAQVLNAGFAFKGPLMDMLREVNEAGKQGKTVVSLTWTHWKDTIRYEIEYR